MNRPRLDDLLFWAAILALVVAGAYVLAKGGNP